VPSRSEPRSSASSQEAVEQHDRFPRPAVRVPCQTLPASIAIDCMRELCAIGFKLRIAGETPNSVIKSNHTGGKFRCVALCLTVEQKGPQSLVALKRNKRKKKKGTTARSGSRKKAAKKAADPRVRQATRKRRPARRRPVKEGGQQEDGAQTTARIRLPQEGAKQGSGQSLPLGSLASRAKTQRLALVLCSVTAKRGISTNYPT